MKISNFLLEKINKIIDRKDLVSLASYLKSGDVDTSILSLHWKFVFAKCAGWHNDKDAATYNEFNEPIPETFIVVRTAGHLVEAGKKQNLPLDQPPGTVFQMDSTKTHRLNSRGNKKSIWIGLFRPTSGSIEDDIQGLEAIIGSYE